MMEEGMEFLMRYKWYLIGGTVAAVLLGASIYFIGRSFGSKKPIENEFAKLNSSPEPETEFDLESEISSESGSLLQTDYTTKALIAQVTELTKAVRKITTLEDKVKKLENANSNLSERLAKYEGQQAIQTLNSTGVTTTTSTTSTTASQTKSPVYIPIAVNGEGASTDWTTLSNAQVSINPADYAGYTNMYLVVNLQVYQGNGTAYARIANSSNGLAILSSQVSTTNQSYTLLTSSGFQLPSGNNTYSVQLRSLVGSSYPAMIENAWIKVVFN